MVERGTISDTECKSPVRIRSCKCFKLFPVGFELGRFAGKGLGGSFCKCFGIFTRGYEDKALSALLNRVHQKVQVFIFGYTPDRTDIVMEMDFTLQVHPLPQVDRPPGACYKGGVQPSCKGRRFPIVALRAMICIAGLR